MRLETPVSAPPRTAIGRRPSITDTLWQPVDIASLVAFRVFFGTIMLWEVIRFFGHGWISKYYLQPPFLFKYFGFEWVQPWPGLGMYLHFVALALLAIFILLGFCFRVSAALFFIGFAYVFLLDQSNYLNHFYLLVLLSLLLACVPASRTLSLDVHLGRTRPSDVAPAWCLWALRAQLGLVYFYGGIAKLGGDWLQGEPIRQWLAARHSLPLVGPFMDDEWLVWVFVYGGLLFDLLIAPALVWRKTRAWAFGASVIFHVMNSIVFTIGIFPPFMIAATTLFFDPDWPRRVVPFPEIKSTPRDSKPLAPPIFIRRAVVGLLAVYFAIQMLVPLRHWLYPGNVNWTEEGHRFSWRMKLRDKRGDAQFLVTNPATSETRSVNPAEILNVRQRNEMSTRPDMLLQFAHYLAQEARKGGVANPEVRVIANTSLNGRRPQLLVDPSVDLAKEPRTLRHASWITPLREPLRVPTKQ